MYSLNLSPPTLAMIKNSISLLFCLSLFACSSTEHVSENYFSDDNGYAQGFVNKNFSHDQFTPMNKHTIKKSLPSDHQLMMSLLNRPVTADQAMMIAFEQERASYDDAYATYAVQIKGDKNSDNTSSKTEHIYAKLIAQDINAVRIRAPQ